MWSDRERQDSFSSDMSIPRPSVSARRAQQQQQQQQQQRQQPQQQHHRGNRPQASCTSFTNMAFEVGLATS